MPSSGESTRRSCPQCHGRMSSFSLDRHTIFTKCRGSDCGIVVGVMSACLGPVRRWSLTLN